MLKPRLFLIDATAFCYRAFYAIRGLSTSFGQPTNAVYGFLNMLRKILKEKKPQYLAVCFDVSRDTFRQKKYAEYKINRPVMPDELGSQIPVIKEIISAYGISIFQKQGFEADDIIATLVEKAKKQGFSATIISQDKDLLQLVDDEVEVLSPHNDEPVFNVSRVNEKFGLDPQQVIDLISFIGDSADNIPAVKGLNEKKAVALIKEYGSVEEILKHKDKITPDSLRQAIEENIELIKLNKELVALDKDMDLDFSPDTVKIGQPDYQQLFKLFKHLEFKAFLKDLPVSDEESQEVKVKKISDTEIEKLINEKEELFLAGQDLANLVFAQQGRIFQADKAASHTQAVLSNPKIKKTGHDLKALKVALNQENIALEGLFFDTRLAAYLINPAKTDYGLIELAWDHLAKSLKNDSLDSARALDLILKLKPKLEMGLEERKLEKLFSEIEMPLVAVLAEMEISGIKIDLELLKKLSGELEKRLAGLIADIYKISGCEFNINSPKQLREVLFEKLKLPVVKKNKTGPSTDEEVLNKLADKHELPAKLLEYRQLTKLKSTYIDALPLLVDAKTGRLHTSFNQAGTETGRLSSSNPNLQNIPIKTDLGKKIREAIIAFSQDSYLLSCDYSQIELRILAHLSRDEILVEAFKQGEDIHCKTASLIYGIEEKDVNENMRDVAKRVNFGIVYGLSAYGLSRDLHIGQDQAQGFIDAYFARYPGVKDFIDRQIEKAEEEGFVTTMLGRRRYLPEIKSRNLAVRQLAQRQAVNTPIQGSASDLIKLAMVNIQQEIKQRQLKGKMILQIHDELLFDVAGSQVREFSALVKDKMENVLKLEVPIGVSIKKGKNWLTMEEIG